MSGSDYDGNDLTVVFSKRYPWYKTTSDREPLGVGYNDDSSDDEGANIPSEELDKITQLQNSEGGWKFIDLHEPADQTKLKLRMAVASAAGTVVSRMDNNQIFRMLDELTDDHSLAYFIDWDKLERAKSEVQIAFRTTNELGEGVSSEDVIRQAYVAQGARAYTRKLRKLAKDKETFDKNPDAATIMQKLLLETFNTRSEVQEFSSIPEARQSQTQRNRAVYYHIRHDHLTINTRTISKQWKAIHPKHYRTTATLRRAFDYLNNMHDPTFPWPCSHAYFEATLDILRSESKLCMAVFEEDTKNFLKLFREAMEGAEKRRMKEWMEARSDKQFYDLHQTAVGPNFKDEIETIE